MLIVITNYHRVMFLQHQSDNDDTDHKTSRIYICNSPNEYSSGVTNHAKSLKLEEQTLGKITLRIQEKVMHNAGTWIDWQYLLDATTLLKKVISVAS